MNDEQQHNGHIALTHSQAQELLAAEIVGETTSAEHAAFTYHLKGCLACQQAMQEARRITAMLAEDPQVVTRQPSLADAIMLQIAHDSAVTSTSTTNNQTHSSHPRTMRPVHDEQRIIEASSNADRTARHADHAPRQSSGATLPMHSTTTSEQRISRARKPHVRSLPFVAIAATVLMALLAVGLFLARAPKTLHTVTTPGASIAGNSPILSVGMYAALTIPPAGAPITASNPTTTFKVGQNIYVLLSLNNQTKTGDLVAAKWLLNGLDITPDLQKMALHCCSVTIQRAGTVQQVYFQFVSSKTGHGSVAIAYNGKVIDTIAFTVNSD